MDIDLKGDVENSVMNLKVLFLYLDTMGVKNYCVFDPGIVRGLAYYTGVVFEVHDIAGDLRAIAGGGRYDNLLGDFGGPKVTGTGMGMGDCVLEILLREKELLGDNISTRNLDYFIAYLDSGFRTNAIALAAKLRHAGFATDFSYKSIALKKQLKQASAANAKKCIIIGDEFKDKGLLAVKDMGTSEQTLLKFEEIFS